MLRDGGSRFQVDKVKEYRRSLDGDSAVDVGAAVIELLDSKDRWLLLCAIELCGNFLMLYNAKPKLLELLEKDIVLNDDGLRASLFTTLGFLEVKESVPFLCDYIDGELKRSDGRPGTHAALNALMSNDPYTGLKYLRRVFDYEMDKDHKRMESEEFFRDAILSGFTVSIWEFLIKTGVEGEKKLSDAFRNIDNRYLGYYIESLQQALEFRYPVPEDLLDKMPARLPAGIKGQLKKTIEKLSHSA